MDELSLQQLEEIDERLEEFRFTQPAFKGEQWAPSYKKDPKLFKKIIAELVSFKRDLKKYFKNLHDQRWLLIKYYKIPLKSFDDSEDDYFYDDQWDDQDQQLAQVVEQHKSKSYELGLLALLLLLKTKTNLSAHDAQVDLTAKSLFIANAINDVTRTRIAKQIDTSLKLGENRQQFEDRLRKVIINDDRASLIASNEALQAFTDGKKDGAVESGFQYKTWEGSQTDPNDICTESIGETVPIDQGYSNGLEPVYAHVNCQCYEDYSNDPNGN